ncbi:MAG: TerB family tellurite resistance protein [Myxococcales bacterium]|nr:TerB family tellurite resistance protein [Myxococcales bacterium]MDH3483962.1 TerB family tellurite resistance protein [Myxococcales bacterium]
MGPDESVAYATATWGRFNATVSGDLLRALSGAFALVATADGELARSEVAAFVELLRSKADVFSGIDFNALETTFRDLTESLIADPEGGRLQALDCVAKVKGNAEQCALVRSGAEIAIAADGRVRTQEAAVLEQICQALGLKS